MKYTASQTKQDKRLAELLGLTLEEVREKRRIEKENAHVREAQAIPLFIEQPERFMRKKCDNCKEEFLTTYRFVGLCSTQCRIESLEKIGINWNPLHTSDERWKRTQIPTEYSIPPAALKILIEIAQDQENEPVSVPSSIDQPYNDIHTDQDSSPPELTEDVSTVDPVLTELGLP